MIVRPATVDDATALAALHVRTWQAAYADALPASYLSSLDSDRRAEWWRRTLADIVAPTQTYVAELGGAVIGFASVGPYRADGDQGEVYAIYVDPPHWSTGAGLVLMRRAVEHLTQAGLYVVRLWVLADNPRARRFYERFGFVADGATKVETIGGDRPDATEVVEVRYTLARKSAAGG